jgi:L-lactate dehydrogenase complex protein LldE
MLVDIFIPCVIDQFYPQTGWNFIKVLEKSGCSVNYNIEQTCCGQVAFNAGYWDDCKEIGSKFIKEFVFDRYIVSPSYSCVNMVKHHYSEMFFNTVLHNEYKQVQRNIYEVSNFLVNILKITDLGAQLNAKGVFMNTCSSTSECLKQTEALALLKNVKDLKLLSLDNPTQCCGFGGMFAVKNEPLSVKLGEEKINDALNVGAEVIISSDVSCLMHLDSIIKKKNLSLKTMHLVDVLSS